jgi:hypothetical protein
MSVTRSPYCRGAPVVGQNRARYADPDLRRRFTYHSEAPLRALLAAAGYAVGEVERHRSNRDWLTLRASRR